MKPSGVRSIALSLLTSLVVISNPKLALGQSFGPYVVNRSFALPQFSLGDLEYADGFLYSSDHSRAYIYKLNPVTGEMLQLWTPFGPGAFHIKPSGLAWDGANLWMTDRDPKLIYKLDLPVTGEGSPLSSIQLTASPGLTGWPMDLAYANGYFYYPEYMGPIHKIDAQTGVQVGTIPSPSQTAYGITFDGQNLLVAEGAGPGTLWVVSPENGTVLETWQTGLLGMTGLAYDLSTHSLYMGNGNSAWVAQLVPEPTAAAFGTLASILVLFLEAAANSNRKR